LVNGIIWPNGGELARVSEENLKELRRGIRAVDSELIGLVGRRLGLVRKVGMLKRELKMPIVDRSTERAVIENFVTSAIEAGIDQRFARRIAKLLIEASVKAQKAVRPNDPELPQFEKVAILGAGGMGSWFARFFKARGSVVTVSDRDRRKARLLASKTHVRWASDNVEAVRGSDVVVLATPANVTSDVINEILPTISRNALLVEICAVKSAVMPALHLAGKKGVKIASIHPMFGPRASGIREKNVIVIRLGGRRGGSDRAKHLLEGARFLLADAQVHDRQTAITLALPHFLNMAFAMTLSGRSLAEIRKFAGRTFDLQMLLAQTVGNEPQTTADILTLNKEFRVVLGDLVRNTRLLAKIVSGRDREKLIRCLGQIREHLSSDPKFPLSETAFERACEASSIEGSM
jgi:chorismate mutase / prephenate dehydrogenase